MQIEMVDPKLLKKAEYNPRIITETEMTKLRRSIVEFGFVEPVVVNQFPGRENVIVGGHQRVDAAIAENLIVVPCVNVNLPLPREKLLNLALNRISGVFDDEKLRDVITDLQLTEDGISLSGFDEAEIEKLLKNIDSDTNTLLDERPTKFKCPECGYEW